MIVRWLDRFGRNAREILRRIWELQERAVTVEAADEDLKAELMLLTRAGIAGAESRRTGERVRANMNNSVRKGSHPGRTPYGLRPVRELVDGKAVTVRWEVNETEAAVIREVYRLIVEENYGFLKVADSLNERGMRGRAGVWSSASIRDIMRNPHLNGVQVYGRKGKPTDGDTKPEVVTVRDAYPKVLSDDEWAALQQRLEVRKESAHGHTHASTYLLSGILRCGHCGSPMVGTAGRRYRGYTCSARARARAACPETNGHSTRKLEAAVLAFLGQWSDPAKVRAELASMQPKDTGALERQLQDVEAKLTALDKVFHQNVDLLRRGILDEAEFQRDNAVRRDERARLENLRADLEARAKAQKAQTASAAAIPAKVQGFMTTFLEGDVRKSKAQLQLLLKAVHVYKDGRFEVEFR